MSYLTNEILLRLAKLVAAGIIGAVLYAIAVLPLHVAPSFELAALCWISAAVALLLVESSPIRGGLEAPPGRAAAVSAPLSGARKALPAGAFDTAVTAPYHSASRPGPAVLWTVGERAVPGSPRLTLMRYALIIGALRLARSRAYARVP